MNSPARAVRGVQGGPCDDRPAQDLQRWPISIESPGGSPGGADRRAASPAAELDERERRLRAATAALEERERAVQAAEELARVGSWMWEVGSAHVSWSEYVHRIFGTDPAGPQATYQFYVSKIHPDDRGSVMAVIRNAELTGERYEVDHRIVRQDGEIREVRGSGRAELDAHGRAVRFTGGLQDVTEMRLAARDLQRSRDLFAGVLDAATEQSIIATDPQGLITVFNTGAERMLGYTAEEMIGTSPERVHDAEEIRHRAAELRMEPNFGVFLAKPATGTPETRQWTYITRDGRRLLASITVSAMWGPRGELTGFIKVGTDITELQRSRDLFAGVLDAATEQSIIATDPQGSITVFNTGAERMLGYTAEEMIGTSPERVHDAAEIRHRAAELRMEPNFGVFLAKPATGTPETRQWTYITRDGRQRLASITVSAMWGSRGELTGFIKVGTDITERVKAQTSLEASEARFRNMFQHAPNGVMLLGIGGDNLGRFLQVNPAMCRLTGYSQEQLTGMSLAGLVAPDDLTAYRERLAALRRNPVLSGPVERHWIRADGKDLWVQVNLSPGEATADGAYVVGQVEDITARKEAEETLRHQALHDGLTGLPNRVLLMDRIQHALAVGQRTDQHVGVLYVDLDGFKAVNDSAGHAAGDRALVHVANQMRAVLRPGDTVARLGGDEFVVVCENLESPAAATPIADRILACIRVPFTAGGQAFALSGSIGVSVSERSSSSEHLLQQADQAMYIAKGAGKGRVQFGTTDDGAQLAESAQASRLMRLTAELGFAVERDELVVFGQPVLDLLSGTVVAVESLIRWAHPAQGILAPGKFIDVAEATELMLPIGRRVLRESCRMAATWVDQLGAAAPAIHVNVSGRQLEVGNLHHEVLQALDDFELAPERLVIELTETHMPLIAHSLRSDLQVLRERGVKVAIDDLGTGYSSLTRITELPVDILKIDLSFVAGMETDPACAAVVRGILAIGHALGLDVIAEGVETVSQADRLREYGCTTAQGYLYSRPLPEPELRRHLGTRLRRHGAMGSGRVPSAG